MTATGTIDALYFEDLRAPLKSGLVDHMVARGIRPMQLSDVDAMLELARAMHEESVYRHLPFDDQKVAELVRACSMQDSWAGFVAVENGRLYGFFAGHITEYFFSRERMAKDIGLYVVPEKRGRMTAVRLIKIFIRWAAEKGVTEVALGVSALEDNSRTYALYQRLGLEPVAQLFKRRL